MQPIWNHYPPASRKFQHTESRGAFPVQEGISTWFISPWLSLIWTVSKGCQESEGKVGIGVRFTQRQLLLAQRSVKGCEDLHLNNPIKQGEKGIEKGGGGLGSFRRVFGKRGERDLCSATAAKVSKREKEFPKEREREDKRRTFLF